MKKFVLGPLFVLLALAVTLSELRAVTKGSISGIVKSDEGARVAGAKVKLSGPFLPAGREYTTTANGLFRFPSLPPGTYLLEVEHAQMAGQSVSALVSLDRDTQVTLILVPVGRAEEEVTVMAASPIVDIKSTEVSINWDKQTFINLPLGRSYASLLQLAPSVADNRDYAPQAGGNRQDNVFLYDGANITNPLFGHLGANFSELDIQEVNIKRGAISAEFGRAAGMVTNAVTKSGTNLFSGSLRFILEPASFTWKSVDPNIVTKTNVLTPALGIGGPIIRDRLWFYLSGNLPQVTTTDRVNNLGPVPDSKYTSNEFFVKLSANPTARHLLSASFRTNSSKSENGGIGVNDAPTVATDSTNLDRIIFGSWTWNISSSSYLEVKYNHVDEKGRSDPITDLGYKPTFDPTHLEQMGYFLTATGYVVGGATTTGQYVGGAPMHNRQDYYRDEVKAVFSQYLDFRGQSHLLKLGFGFEDGGEYLERLANGWGTVTYVSSLAANVDLLRRPGFRGRHYPQQDPQDSRGRTYSIFLQDTASIGSRLTINAGVLLNRDEFSTQTFERRTFLKFNFDKEVQPRIGFTYIFDKRVGDKFFANYGRYYCMDNKSIARAAAPLRNYRSDAYFLTDGTFLADIPQASETGKVILPGVRPTYQDEFVVGYSRPITKKWFAEVWGQYRTVTDVIEDYPTVNRSAVSPGSFVYGNLDGSEAIFDADGKFVSGAFGSKAGRIYKAVSFQLQRPFADRWSLTFNYTWSRMEGNWDLDYAAGTQLFYASSYIEDGPGLYLLDPNRRGILSGDRTHLIKGFFTWEFLKRTFVGAYLRIQSGRPWEARTYNSTAGAYYTYAEPAGTSRLKTWANLDVQVSHTFPFGKFRGVLEARMMNVFDAQTGVTLDVRSDQPTYKSFTSYASPRKFVLSFYINF